MQHRFRPLRRAALLLAATAFATGLTAPATAANWPTGPVTIIIPFSPGGTTDVVGRLIGAKLSELWKQTVVIENKLGAGGNIGAAIVAKANPDGHTILLASGSILTVNPHLYKNLPFDVNKDFELITNVAEGPMVVVTAKKLPVKTLQELIDLAKKNPKTLNMGSAGLGSQVHMAGENFAYASKIDVTHVPYRGEAAAYTDLMAGQIDFIVGNIGAVTPLAQADRLNALAVTSKTRAKMLPDLPTVSEAGVPGFENSGWFAFVGPKGMPKEIVDKIQKDTAKVLAMPDIKKRLEDQGMTAVGNTPAEFKKAMDAESANWTKVIKERNIKIN
ncbi:tripartite tricarboxylate transporter substrate binding protein [Alcaligenaceae bacterium]|nr:tripartite tricarboxylate transporter substrate binding protein [Alcaligenaceae bacterium]